mgnify:CR=1 FL=1
MTIFFERLPKEAFLQHRKVRNNEDYTLIEAYRF